MNCVQFYKQAIVLNLFTLLLFFYSCKSFKASGHEIEGRMDEKDVILNFIDNGADSSGFLTLKKKKWFSGDFIIEEVRTLKSVTDTGKHTMRNYVLSCCVFKDLKHRKAYAYAHFSDTAKPQLSFKIDDTLQLINGGYYEHPTNTQLHFLRSYFVSDTVINNVVLKRAVQVIKDDPKEKVIDSFFLRCDLDKFAIKLYNLNDSLNRLTNCITMKAVRVLKSLNETKLLQSAEANIYYDPLAPEEERVFKAWAKNVQIY